MSAPLRWAQAGGKRHAVRRTYQPRAGDTFTALCAAEVTVARKDDTALGASWLDPTCQACNTAWLLEQQVATR